VAEQLLAQRSGLGFRLAPSQVVIHCHGDREDPVARARRLLPHLERAVGGEPDEPFHRYNLGMALLELGLHGEAEAALRAGVGAAAKDAIWVAPALAALSRTVSAQGRKDEAVKLSKAATKKAPDWMGAWCQLGEALIDAGRVEAGLRALLRALDAAHDPWLAVGDPADPAWPVRAAIGKVHLARGEYAAATQWLADALAGSPAHAELRIWLAQACQADGQSGRAQELFEAAASDARGGADAFLGLGDFFTAKAESVLLRGLADNAESRQLLERIERLRAAQAML
jgi:tetratricopeptide (TPR) repeat protein